MRLGGTRLGTISTGRGLGNQLWDVAGNVPTLDLRFAESKSLVDAVTGQSLITFTRASSGTYVGSDGLLKTATTNLLTYSKQFNDAAWTTSNATVSADQIASPSGTLTADALVENLSTGNHSTGRSVTGLAAGVYTLTVFAKAAGRSNLVLTEDSSTFSRANFNLATGVIVGTAGSGSASIQPLSNGWHRCSIQLTIPAGGTFGVKFSLAIDASVAVYPSYAGDGASGVYLWGAQLEQSSTVGEYIPTTSTINSAPRFDHNPTTGESLGLLVEEQRTNLLTYSAQFDNLAWMKQFASVTADSISAPDGTTTADFFTDTTDNQRHFLRQTFTPAGSTTYTKSVYAKAAASARFLQISMSDAGAGKVASFNLVNGTLGAVQDTGVTRQITPVGNGWYRCSMTYTMSATPGTSNVDILITATDTRAETYVGNGTSGIYLWGIQLEAGAFPTSYIPTTTATVTRSADVASISQQNLNTIYSNQPGTFFVDARDKAAGTVGGLFSVVGSVFPGHFSVQYRGGSPAWFVGMNTPGSNLWASDNGTAFYTRDLVAVSAGSNGASFYTNGVLSSSTAADLSNKYVPSSLVIGLYQSSYLNGHLSRLTYWPQRLPDSTLQTITQ